VKEYAPHYVEAIIAGTQKLEPAYEQAQEIKRRRLETKRWAAMPPDDVLDEWTRDYGAETVQTVIQEWWKKRGSVVFEHGDASVEGATVA
jgi:hypothetical protein